MNVCVFSGYVELKAAYNQNKDGRLKFDFYVSVENDDGIARTIPFRAYDDMATKVYANLQVGYYVEITSKYIRLDNVTNYFVVKDLMYKAPKTSNQYYIKSSELLEMFNPKKVLERMKNEKK